MEYAKRAEIFELGLETMKKVWTKDNISMKTPYFELDGISVEPKPVQKPHPPIWIVALILARQERGSSRGSLG